MICKRCKSATAIISLPSHNTGFCENCFRDFFSAQVARGIETGKLFTHEDRILVALLPIVPQQGDGAALSCGGDRGL